MPAFRSTRYAATMTLQPDVARLAVTLEAMTTLLRLYGNNGWAERLERCRSSIARSDYHGVAQLLRFYGGMGSLNDVILQTAGITPADDNNRFDGLRTAAWEQAHALVWDERGEKGD